MSLAREFAPREGVRILSLVSFLLVGGCTVTQTEDNDATNTFVSVVNVTAEAGDFTTAEESDFLLSDVCAANDDNPPCSVFNDNAIVTFEARPKDIAVFSSQNNDIVFERYRVTYTRADGRNVPGVDVPYPFDGVSSFRVGVDGTEVAHAIIVVRHQAKLESPLRELSLAASGVLSVLARMDFYGRDGAGRELMVTAYLSVTFADFGND